MAFFNHIVFLLLYLFTFSTCPLLIVHADFSDASLDGITTLEEEFKRDMEKDNEQLRIELGNLRSIFSSTMKEKELFREEIEKVTKERNSLVTLITQQKLQLEECGKAKGLCNSEEESALYSQCRVLLASSLEQNQILSTSKDACLSIEFETRNKHQECLDKLSTLEIKEKIASNTAVLSTKKLEICELNVELQAKKFAEDYHNKEMQSNKEVGLILT